MESARQDRPPLSEILALAPVPIACFDPDGRLSAVNPRLCDLLRPMSAYLAPGTPWPVFLREAAAHGLIPEETCRSLRLIEEHQIAGPQSHLELVAPVGESGFHTLSLAGTSDGGFALTLQATANPTGQGESERELEQLMAKVLAACPTCLTMARIGDGRILYRSPAATELLGKGVNSREHFAHREERADFITALMPGARVDDMRVTGRRGDGSTFPASISARLIDYRGEEVIVSSMLDLTEELTMQRELALQKEQIFQAEKMSALGELLAGVAHELNNPLSIVIGNAQMLLEDEIGSEALRRVEKLSDAAERCVRIVRTFLAMARERPLEISPVPANALIALALDAFRDGEAGDRTEVLVEVADGLPDLLVDEVQIVQVLNNLLTNADQAMAEAGIGNQVRISVQPGPCAGRVRIRTADDGPGVPEAIAGRIFDPLFTTKAAGQGTGVGLALCHRIVTAHGGKIELDRSTMRGSCFLLDLPAAG
jgi:PAS domain S-box-containing protein